MIGGLPRKVGSQPHAGRREDTVDRVCPLVALDYSNLVPGRSCQADPRITAPPPCSVPPFCVRHGPLDCFGCQPAVRRSAYAILQSTNVASWAIVFELMSALYKIRPCPGLDRALS